MFHSTLNDNLKDFQREFGENHDLDDKIVT